MCCPVGGFFFNSATVLSWSNFHAPLSHSSPALQHVIPINVRTSMWKMCFISRCCLTKKAEPPPTRDVNRDSGTASANGGWLRRLVRQHLVYIHINLAVATASVKNHRMIASLSRKSHTEAGQDSRQILSRRRQRVQSKISRLLAKQVKIPTAQARAKLRKN